MASAAVFAARTTILKTRVNDAELNFIVRKASARGVSVGTYLRMAALQRREQRSSQLVIEIQRAVAGAECNTVIELKLEHHAA
jgi:hypothetical protein